MVCQTRDGAPVYVRHCTRCKKVMYTKAKVNNPICKDCCKQVPSKNMLYNFVCWIEDADKYIIKNRRNKK